MIKRKLFMIGVETYAAYGTDLGIFSVITWIYTYQICEMYSRSGFLCFGWHADHVISVINMQYKAHALWLQKINQKQQIDKDKPHWKKVKLTSLWLPFLSKGYTCVRKIYSVAVRIKTLLLTVFLRSKRSSNLCRFVVADFATQSARNQWYPF